MPHPTEPDRQNRILNAAGAVIDITALATGQAANRWRWLAEFVWDNLGFAMGDPHKMKVAVRGNGNPANTREGLAEFFDFFPWGPHTLAQGRETC
ncbi:MAG TPA: hypothetical protein P5205_15725 [Candidatus Paceibacterota bacterium]|nr:hypothetical protein [Verrucomicrobiota bacterium]HSA11810.1 hypothetical protein [Candidatus Paceibacterota bacterium]